jgi:hypothetical protein
MADENPGKLFWITDQVPATRVTPAGRFEDGYEVLFMTAVGVEGKLFVPQALYSPENVGNLVRSEALRIVEVAGLAE